MEMMIVIVTMLCVTFSLWLNTNAFLHTHDQLQASHELAHAHQLDHTALPRKLMINEKVEGYEPKDWVSNHGQSKALSGESHKKGDEVVVVQAAAKGTRQEWIEGSDPTHFFTMDYSHVRRRRPIHNKAFPKGITSSP